MASPHLENDYLKVKTEFFVHATEALKILMVLMQNMIASNANVMEADPPCNDDERITFTD
jgi:hypothetical protein